MINVIETVELDKRFAGGRKAVAALSRLSIRVPQGGVYGILGQNGAGKSTLFRIALGLVRPDTGTVRVLGRQPGADSNLCWEVGAMLETPHFFNFLTAAQTLQMLAQLRGTRYAIPPKSLLARVGLADGMDPIGIQEIRHLIRELSAKDGVTVVLASHHCAIQPRGQPPEHGHAR